MVELSPTHPQQLLGEQHTQFIDFSSFSYYSVYFSLGSPPRSTLGTQILASGSALRDPSN